ncbi:MAG TPA: hypothetical protein VE980_15000 [Pyrinomonadaceae bacterium]|nr:hypothetical protein [Pyrinomonadaceae bacterium]
MSYKCPLCLTVLTSEIRLERYCVKHPRSRKEFPCGTRTLKLEIYCSERGDNCNVTTEGGVFFRHIGCKYKNPFWNEDKGVVEIPVRPEETSAIFPLSFPNPVRVQHWILGVLALLPKNVSEMWFPAMLLRATAETNSFWKRVGVLVELAGAQESGKTILAMMSMNSRGYALNNGSSLELELRDFIYTSQEGQLPRYIETLHLSTLLRDGQRRGLFRPQGTVRGRSIKVSFIKPSKQWQVPVDDDVSDDLSLPKRLVLKTLYALPNLIKEFASETGLVIWQIMHSTTHYPFWYTVILYDTAGEANDAKDFQPELQAIDKVAIVINAGEIFGLLQDEVAGKTTDEPDNESEANSSLSDQSLRTACERIKTGVDHRQKLYLVVTQMDRIKERINDDWTKVETIADSVGTNKYKREAKELLRKWLSESPSPHAAELRSKLQLIVDVFFMWTDDLPQSRTPANQETLPRSRGLAKFMCDCLGVKTNQIVR